MCLYKELIKLQRRNLYNRRRKWHLRNNAKVGILIFFSSFYLFEFNFLLRGKRKIVVSKTRDANRM